MEAITASLVYLLLRQDLQMLTQLARDGGAEDVESWPRGMSGVRRAGDPLRHAVGCQPCWRLRYEDP